MPPKKNKSKKKQPEVIDMDNLVDGYERQAGIPNRVSEFLNNPTLPMQNLESLGSTTNLLVQHHFDSINQHSIE